MSDIDRDIISVAAHNAGAQYIEKHICMNREELKEHSNDYHSALEPEEFRDYVQFMKQQNGKIGVIV
jgi:sialic acid synthase SpsE